MYNAMFSKISQEIKRECASFVSRALKLQPTIRKLRDSF